MEGLKPYDALHDIAQSLRSWFVHGDRPQQVVMDEMFGWLFRFSTQLKYPMNHKSDGVETYMRHGEFKAVPLIKCPMCNVSLHIYNKIF